MWIDILDCAAEAALAAALPLPLSLLGWGLTLARVTAGDRQAQLPCVAAPPELKALLPLLASTVHA